MNKVGNVGMTQYCGAFAQLLFLLSSPCHSKRAHIRCTGNEISHLVWKPKFYNRILNTQPLDPVLSHVYPVQNHIIHSFTSQFILFFSLLRLGLSRGVALSGSPTKTLHRVLTYSMSDIHPTLLLFFITRDSSDRS